MATHSHAHDDKVKITIQLSEDERIYIKLLATKKKMTISDFIMSFVRPNIPSHKIPNAETERAIRDIEENKNLQRFKTVDDFWKAMGIDPHA